MIRLFTVISGFLALLFLVGCGPDIQDFQYQPHPGVAAVPATQPQQGPPVEVLATIVGIHHETADDKSAFVVDTRLRVQNYSNEQVSVDPRTLELTNSDLVKFPPARISIPDVVAVAPNQPLTVTALFPLPPNIPLDKLNLNALTLRWALDLDGQRLGQVMNFRRVVYQNYYYGPYYGDPFYPYPYGFYGGVVIVRHR